jgi:dienelactone hydrolase
VLRNHSAGHWRPAVLLGVVMIVVVGVTVILINREGIRGGPAASGTRPGPAASDPAASGTRPGPASSSDPSPGRSQPSSPPPSPPSPGRTRSAPSGSFAVGVRHLALGRTVTRPLPTTVWYPAPGGARGGAEPGARVAAGRFPLVLLSHGLPSLPETYADVAVRLAAAGFVVAAPRYPNTNLYAANPTMADVPNQPADAFYVVESVLRLDAQDADPLAGHLDTSRYAAVGHSAGGFTTSGMLAWPRDGRLAAAVIIAGGTVAPYRDPPAEVLFIHGEADRTISYADGHASYVLLPWSKAFLTVIGGDHLGYLTAGRPGFGPVMRTMRDFLRATLYGDEAARRRLPADGSADGARFEHRLWSGG